MVNIKNTSTSNFYAGKSVFITGGTGFIGKVLVEKLLYSCIDIDKIYLLVRSKENSSGNQRIQEIIDKPLFERIKKVNPESLKKLVPITGDILENNLGISAEDERLIIDTVSVVFHSAADVGFMQRLDLAVKNNYDSTKMLVSLCQRMKNLKSLIYFSTTFINPQHPYLDEVVYPPPVTTKQLQTFIDQKGMDEERKLEKFLHGRPNTYTFTKALSEHYVATNHGNVPTTIIRPSIVTSSATEPIPGWIDAWSGATGIVATTCLGYSHVLVGAGSNTLDVIPVDYVTNLSIVAAANRKNNLEIYNSCTTACNPLTIKDFYMIVTKFTKANGYNELPIFTILTKDGMSKQLYSFLLEKVPAIIADSWLRIKREKPSMTKKAIAQRIILLKEQTLIFSYYPLRPQAERVRYVKLQSRVSENRELIKFFTSHTYSLSAKNTIALSRSLTEKDRTIFPFNPQELNWKQYLPVYCQGIRRFLLRK